MRVDDIKWDDNHAYLLGKCSTVSVYKLDGGYTMFVYPPNHIRGQGQCLQVYHLKQDILMFQSLLCYLLEEMEPCENTSSP